MITEHLLDNSIDFTDGENISLDHSITNRTIYAIAPTQP